MIRCPKCQRELPEDSKFCNYCGKRFLTSSEKSTKKKVIAIVAVALAVVIAVSGFLVFDKINNKPENDTGKKSDKINKDEEDNNSVINTGDKDIYQAPNGKYYRLAELKVNFNGGYESVEETMSLVWDENSVTATESGSFVYKINNDGMPYECIGNDISYNWTYRDGLLTELSNDSFTYRYEYDKNENIIKRINLIGDITIEIIDYEYDSKNRLIGFTCENIQPEKGPDGTEIPITGPSTADNLEIRYTDKDTITVGSPDEGISDALVFNYNEFGKISDFSLSVSSDQTVTATFVYDENGNLTKASYTSEDPALGTEISTYEFMWEESTKSHAVFSDNIISGMLFTNGIFGAFGDVSFYRNPLTFTHFV